MSVAKSSLLFASGTMISRVAGLVRDRLMLSVFGASVYQDAFNIAFRIPNLLREMLAEGALGSSFTKVYTGLATSERERAEKLLVDSVFLMSLVSVLVCAIGILLAPQLVDLMTLMQDDPVHKAELVQQATGLTRLLFPFLGLMVIGSIAMGACHQQGRFFLTAVSPIMFNVGSILGAVWLAPMFGANPPAWTRWLQSEPMITGLAVGTLLGGLGQVLMQLFGIWRPLWTGLRTRRVSVPWSPDVRRVFFLMAPMVVAASMGQINVIVNTIFATSLHEGAVTELNAAFRLLHFPIGIFGVAIGSAVLPALAKAMAQAGNKVDEVTSREMQNAVQLVLWLMVPCFVFFLANDMELVQFLYQSGRFTEDDARRTATCLFAYSFSLISYGLLKVLTSFFFALEKTKYALKVSVVGIFVNFGVGYLLVDLYGAPGLAFGYSLTLGASVLLQGLGLRGHGVQWSWRNFMICMVYLVFAGGVAALAQTLCQSLIAGLDWVSTLNVALRSGVVLTVDGIVLGGIFIAFGMVYLRMTPTQALAALRRRGRR